MNISELLLNADDDGCNEYKEGFNTAICYLNDNFIIKARNGEPISITFDVELDEDSLIKKLKES